MATVKAVAFFWLGLQLESDSMPFNIVASSARWHVSKVIRPSATGRAHVLERNSF
jgi:hypothetical protein